MHLSSYRVIKQLADSFFIVAMKKTYSMGILLVYGVIFALLCALYWAGRICAGF